MKVKDQIKTRREQLGVTVSELARRLGVSAQAIRYWEAGRSFPGKAKTSALEAALSFSLDWTEGSRAAAKRPQLASLVDPQDMELLMEICRLPAPMKSAVSGLVKLQLAALDGGRKAFTERSTHGAIASFSHAGEGLGGIKGKAKKRHPAGRKAA